MQSLLPASSVGLLAHPPPPHSSTPMRRLLRFKTSILQPLDETTLYISETLYRHYLVIPVEHIGTVKDLQRRAQDYSLVSHMLNVGHTLLTRDAPTSIQYRFGFHQPPFNSVNHLHLHCLALPYIPKWKRVKYSSLGPLGGFIEAHKLLERLKP